MMMMMMRMAFGSSCVYTERNEEGVQILVAHGATCKIDVLRLREENFVERTVIVHTKQNKKKKRWSKMIVVYARMALIHAREIGSERHPKSFVVTNTLGEASTISV